MSRGKPLPIVIAHRGASAYLPEHTAEAKALAHGLGADFLEQDVVATKDGALVVLHDLFLERVTDVAARYPNRSRGDGHFYAIDFELEEIRALNVTERTRTGSHAARYPDRFPYGKGRFRVSTLGDELELIQGLNRSTGKQVGIYTEIKHPAWHLRHGIDLGKLVLEELGRFGYREPSHAAFLQCFDAAELQRLRHDLGSRLNFVQLVEESSMGGRVTQDQLREWVRTVQVIGWPFRALLMQPDAWQKHMTTREIVNIARDLGLAAHAYTFRREDLLPGAQNLTEMLIAFLRHLELQGVFCDHPDIAVRARAAALGPGPAELQG
jgi:glycerophosphoryl diester phosphodiesterase